MIEIELSKGAILVIKKLVSAGYKAYAVGGSVRDTLMCKTPSDFDITTDALPEDTKKLFEDFTTFDAGIKHGTVSVVVDGEVVEITTFRSDGEYSDHRHPVGVSFTSRLEEDLSRRDFTVNAMAYNEDEGVIDLFGGKEDIQKRIIRCVGDAETRFDEDALRILRALRFAAALDFEIEEKTDLAVRKMAHLLTFVSRERICVEIKKLLNGRGATRIINAYPEVFEILFGNLNPMAEALPLCKSEYSRLAVFFYNLPDAFLTLKPSKKESTLILRAIELAGKPMPETEVEIKRLIVSSSSDAVSLSFEIRRALGEKTEKATEILENILSSSLCLRKEDLAIRGNDLVALGVSPSAEMGRLLDALFNAVISGEIKNERSVLLQKAEQIIFEKDVDK